VHQRPERPGRAGPTEPPRRIGVDRGRAEQRGDQRRLEAADAIERGVAGLGQAGAPAQHDPEVEQRARRVAPRGAGGQRLEPRRRDLGAARPRDVQVAVAERAQHQPRGPRDQRRQRRRPRDQRLLEPAGLGGAAQPGPQTDDPELEQRDQHRRRWLAVPAVEDRHRGAAQEPQHRVGRQIAGVPGEPRVQLVAPGREQRSGPAHVDAPRARSHAR
jgi:hypothetical protein